MGFLEGAAVDTEVVVVGGGVAGCALAVRLAEAGVAVTVLERERVYRDIVRGEALVPWGFQEAVQLGIAETILATHGASVMTRMVPYDESLTVQQAQRRSRDLANVVDGAPGVIGVGHPELREALATAAAKAGATVIRGVRRSTVNGGVDPSVSYDVDGCTRVERCRLVVGADGKKSATRAALGLPLSTTQARVRLTGMLVDDGGAWDRAETAISVDGRNQFIVIPRADSRLRLYVARGDDDPEPLQGPGAAGEFLKSFRTPIFPASDALAQSTPIGPCATFPMNDAWVDEPVVDGVALVGDAAGWSNPVTAQGLAISLRDARILAETLLSGPDWTPRGLAGYGEERLTRMARLRFASALTDLLTGFGMPDRAARRSRMLELLRRRPELGAALDAVHAGPWAAPAQTYTPDILTTVALA